MNNYITDKIKEINSLDNNITIKTNDIFEILDIKERVVKELRDKNEKKYYHNLTNNNQISFKNNILSYDYTYERFNGFIEIDKFVNNFYKINKSYLTYNYFTNCGMSAIISLLTSIVLSNNCSIDLLYEETYFETIKYLMMINKIENNNKFLYIDSIASIFEFDIGKYDLSKYIGIIIDTTCFEGYEFKEMIESIIKSNKLCILVRSHTKIDILATEYSHLGSVSFIYPKEIKDSDKELFDKIKFDCRHLIGVYGACLPPNRFPEFMLDKDINLLNHKRLNKVKRNNEKLFKYLLNKNIDIELPNHKQFTLIYLGNLSCELDELKKKIIDFCNTFKNRIPIYHAVSFGFDYIAIDCYQNYIDKKYKIRICMSDYPDEINNIFYKELHSFLKNISSMEVDKNEQ